MIRVIWNYGYVIIKEIKNHWEVVVDIEEKEEDVSFWKMSNLLEEEDWEEEVDEIVED